MPVCKDLQDPKVMWDHREPAQLDQQDLRVLQDLQVRRGQQAARAPSGHRAMQGCKASKVMQAHKGLPVLPVPRVQ